MHACAPVQQLSALKTELVASHIHMVLPSKLGTNALWPPSAQVLVPHGAQALVDAAVQWLRLGDAGETLQFGFLANVARFCDALLEPAFASGSSAVSGAAACMI